MEIRKCLDDFRSTQKSVFCKAIGFYYLKGEPEKRIPKRHISTSYVCFKYG